MRVLGWFRIDGPAFRGWHDPADRWNGWATPSFPRAEVERIIAWIDLTTDPDDDFRMVFRWRGPELTVFERQGDDVHEIVYPGHGGCYALGAGAWTWECIDDDGPPPTA